MIRRALAIDESNQGACHPDIRLEAFDATVGFEGLADRGIEFLVALSQRHNGFLFGAGFVVEFGGEFRRFAGALQPHQADVVHVRADGCDVAAFAVGWRCAPGFIGQIADQVFVDSIVRGEGHQ